MLLFRKILGPKLMDDFIVIRNGLNCIFNCQKNLPFLHFFCLLYRKVCSSLRVSCLRRYTDFFLRKTAQSSSFQFPLKVFNYCNFFLPLLAVFLITYSNSALLKHFKPILGGDYMIPVCRDEIHFRFAGIPAVL